MGSVPEITDHIVVNRMSCRLSMVGLLHTDCGKDEKEDYVHRKVRVSSWSGIAILEQRK